MSKGKAYKVAGLVIEPVCLWLILGWVYVFVWLVTVALVVAVMLPERQTQTGSGSVA